MKNDFVFFDSYVCIFISIRQIYSWKQKQPAVKSNTSIESTDNTLLNLDKCECRRTICSFI